MNKVVLGTAIVAILVGVLVGYLGSGLWPAGPQRELQEAKASAARLEAQVGELRAEKDRIGAQLEAERARTSTTEADLRREKEMNAQLHLLVSHGRK
jgi:hypothetical protein